MRHLRELVGVAAGDRHAQAAARLQRPRHRQQGEAHGRGQWFTRACISELVRHITFGDDDFDLEPGQFIV